MKDINQKNYVKENVGQSRIDNLLEDILSKGIPHFCIIIWNFHIDISTLVATTTVGADLRTCQTFTMNFFKKKIQHRCLKGSLKYVFAIWSKKNVQ